MSSDKKIGSKNNNAFNDYSSLSSSFDSWMVAGETYTMDGAEGIGVRHNAQLPRTKLRETVATHPPQPKQSTIIAACRNNRPLTAII